MSAYRHLQRRTEAEVVELWESCRKRWERARDRMAKLDALAEDVIDGDRVRLLASERQTLANGARLAETLDDRETRNLNTPRLETMVEDLRRREQQIERRHRCTLKLPYLPQLPDELDEDTADVVYKQLTTVEASLSWTLEQLDAARERHEQALVDRVWVGDLTASDEAKRDLETIQKALAFESDKVEMVPRHLADRDVRVVLAPIVLLAVVVGIMMMAVHLYATPTVSGAAEPQTDRLSCPSGCDVGKTRP